PTMRPTRLRTSSCWTPAAPRAVGWSAWTATMRVHTVRTSGCGTGRDDVSVRGGTAQRSCRPQAVWSGIALASLVLRIAQESVGRGAAHKGREHATGRLPVHPSFIATAWRVCQTGPPNPAIRGTTTGSRDRAGLSWMSEGVGGGSLGLEMGLQQPEGL